MEDGGQTPQNPVDAFKCGHKMKKAKVKKNQQGGDIMIEKAKGVRMPQRV